MIPVAKDMFLFDGKEILSRMAFERNAAGAISAMRFFPKDDGDANVLPRTDESMPAQQSSITLPRVALQRVTGVYAGGGVELKVFLDGGKLKAQMGPPPAFDLDAKSSHTFFAIAVDATLEFSQGESAAQTVTLHQGMDVIELQRRP